MQKIIWLLVTCAMFFLNGLASWLPINGLSTGELSDFLPTLITPAGFTFAIWSLIYLGLIVLGVLFFLNRVKLPRGFINRYVISSLANGLRIVAWHYQHLHLSMILIVILLLSLIVMDQNIKHHAGSLGRYHRVRNIMLLYFGRVQIASLLMTTIYVTYQLQWIDNQNLTRSLVMIVLAGAVNLLVLRKERNATTSLVALWALRGIASAQTHPQIVQACWLVFAILGANVLAFGMKKHIGHSVFS